MVKRRERLAGYLGLTLAMLMWASPALALTQAELNENRSIWTDLNWTDYEFDFQRSCFCFGDYIRPTSLQIRNGEIATAEDSNIGLPLDVNLFPTVDELFDELQQAIDNGAEEIQVEFSAATGIPVRTFIDHSRLIADEEVFYTTSGATDELMELGCNLGDGIQCGLEFLDALGVAMRTEPADLNYDLNHDFEINIDDRTEYVENRLNTFYGDSNLDSEFNSSDLVQIFQAGEYEDDLVENSTWATGDWTGDGEFDPSDLVLGFQSGYDNGLSRIRPAVPAAVPEPSGLVGFVAALLSWIGFRRPKVS